MNDIKSSQGLCRSSGVQLCEIYEECEPEEQRKKLSQKLLYLPVPCVRGSSGTVRSPIRSSRGVTLVHWVACQVTLSNLGARREFVITQGITKRQISGAGLLINMLFDRVLVAQERNDDETQNRRILSKRNRKHSTVDTSNCTEGTKTVGDLIPLPKPHANAWVRATYTSSEGKPLVGNSQARRALRERTRPRFRCSTRGEGIP